MPKTELIIISLMTSSPKLIDLYCISWLVTSFSTILMSSLPACIKSVESLAAIPSGAVDRVSISVTFCKKHRDW